MEIRPCERERLTEHLRQFVSEEKQSKMAEVMSRRTSHVRIVLEDIFQPHNASAVLRSCECFGIQHLHVIENRFTYRVNRDVVMGASKWITLHRHSDSADNTRECLESLKAQGYRIAATALREDAVPLDALPIDEPVALCFGTERKGLSPTALELADYAVRIPMQGFTQSFNISVSAALCMYDLRRRLDAIGRGVGLSEEDQADLWLEWFRRSVKNSDAIVNAYLKALKVEDNGIGG